MRARAEGGYPAPTGPYPTFAPDSAAAKAAERTANTYYNSCSEGCMTHQDDAQCVELYLLLAELNQSPVDGATVLVDSCNYHGNPAACEWVAAHEEEVTGFNTTRAEIAERHSAERQSAAAAQAAAQAASDAGSEVPGFVAELKERAVGTGAFTLVSDDRYGLESGYTAFAAYLKPGVALNVTIVARSTTPFTAKIRVQGAEEIQFTQLRGVSPGLFVMGVTVEQGDLDGEAQVVVLPDGGDFGDVRVVQLERPIH